MIGSIVKGLVGGVLGGVVDLGKQWMMIRQAKTAAKIAIQDKIATGDIDYNIAAQQGMAASLKDEFLVLWTCGVMTCLFFESTQDQIIEGFKALNELPPWFAICFVGMYVATFGLKGWKLLGDWKIGGKNGG